jgi:2-oxoglutarate ferredoxin oxidoreductase subunit gamma
MNSAHHIVIAGFGGQGVLSMGQLLAYAAMIEHKEITWMPSYGPEMRGGTANCMVIISDKRVSSPIVTQYDSAILLNQPSIDKFQQAVKPGGLLIHEQSTTVAAPTRKDIEILCIAANEEANKLNAKQVANVVLLGAFLARRKVVSPENVIQALKKVLPPHRQNLIPANELALARGAELA